MKLEDIYPRPKPSRFKGNPVSKGKTEHQIELEIISYLTFRDILFWQIKIKGDPTLTKQGIRLKKNKNKGFSDIHVCHKGRAIYLEVKKYGGLCSTEQLETQNKVRTAGGIYEFVTSLEEVQAIIESI